MILGVGVDIVKIDRFKSWESFSRENFLRVFLEDELAYCKQNGSYDYSRLATRFAAKEALFKALSATLVKLGFTENEFSLLFLCRHVRVGRMMWDVPVLVVDWGAIEEKIERRLPELSVDLSLSHERGHAVAFVVISK